jgi:5-hydroxyisourate hydrolase
MGKLTTHVLDISKGTPAKKMKLSLFKIDGEQRTEILSTETNEDGRCGSPLLEGNVAKGTYEIKFNVGDYFAKNAVLNKAKENKEKFLDFVPIQFCISDSSAHYHVPLLVSPWAYSTYRGS